LSTVKGHNLRIFEKLQVKRRTEAIVRARELGLLKSKS
jgi:LuxR family maltose regulon positive regulatory protein